MSRIGVAGVAAVLCFVVGSAQATSVMEVQYGGTTDVWSQYYPQGGGGTGVNITPGFTLIDLGYSGYDTGMSLTTQVGDYTVTLASTGLAQLGGYTIGDAGEGVYDNGLVAIDNSNNGAAQVTVSGLNAKTQYSLTAFGGYHSLTNSGHQPTDFKDASNGTSFADEAAYTITTDSAGSFSFTADGAAGTSSPLAAFTVALIPTYIPGDINGDGLVDVADYNIWAANVGKTGATWSEGDLNGDGLVDVADYNIWAANVGKTAATPEPISMIILAIGGGLVALKRNRA